MKTGKKVLVIVLMCVIGTCMHYVLDVIPNETLARILGIIFPVNGTSWEHMKMLWYPFLLAGIILSSKRRDHGYFSGMVIAGFVAMAMMIGLFAFYESFTGTSVLMLDIIFYMLIMICCALLGFLLATQKWTDRTWVIWAVVAVIITAGIIYLTFNPGSGYVFLDDTGLK